MKVHKPILKFLKFLLGEYANIARLAALMRKPALTMDDIEVQDAMMFWRSLRRLLILVVAFPVPLFVFAVVGKLEWLVVATGLVWAATTVVLGVVLSPIGAPAVAVLDRLSALIGRRKTSEEGGGRLYLRAFLWILLAELSVTGYLSIVPVATSITRFGHLIVVAAIITTIAILDRRFGAFKKLVFTLGVLFFVLHTISFFFPATVSAFEGVGDDIDNTVATGATWLRDGVRTGEATPRTGGWNFLEQAARLGVAAVILLAIVLFVRWLWRKLNDDPSASSKKSPKKFSLGQALAATILVVIAIVIAGMTLAVFGGAIWQTAVSLQAHQEKYRSTSEKLPFCGEEDDAWAEAPASDEETFTLDLRDQCWTSVAISEDWHDFECRDLGNRGFWYWSREVKRPRWVAPNTFFPYREERFAVRGGTKFRCDATRTR